MSSGKLEIVFSSLTTDHLRSANEERAHNTRLQREADEAERAAKLSAFNNRPFSERQAAFNMIRMANNPEVPISKDRMQNLIGTLIVSHPS